MFRVLGIVGIAMAVVIIAAVVVGPLAGAILLAVEAGLAIAVAIRRLRSRNG